MYQKFLFNFSVSFSGGGYKRLQEYAKWFDAMGGASFIIHPNSAGLEKDYPRNRYYVVRQPPYQRLLNDCAYLPVILAAHGRPTLYYSYGIPIYQRVGAVNWFHLSNVLPLQRDGIRLDGRDRLAMVFLGWKIKHNFHNADVVSAESKYSLSLLPKGSSDRQALSVNGSDDELAYVGSGQSEPKEAVATVVGTYRYKALMDSWRIYDLLRMRHPGLRLNVIGNVKLVPRAFKTYADVQLHGLIPRTRTVEILRRSRFYISTTLIENSYNAASEGIFCADESYISDIGPHRELLGQAKFQSVVIPRVTRSMIRVKRGDLSTAHLQTWHAVISDMIARYQSESKSGKLGAGAPHEL